ncbi:MAG: PhnD/SsuA/transferrin family substrate-binding protein [Nitrospirae bacterium]|nr:PhnD/SsuA/transferrin family substrate-binding protein [Nitrospirota bacterium]
MKAAILFYAIFLVTALLIPQGISFAADQFTIAIMQDDKDAAKRYKPLEAYLGRKGVRCILSETPNYSTAAHQFRAGRTDAMFSGSGVAGIFIVKGIANPLVRPVGRDGKGTYHAVVLAKKGSPPYTGSASYFAGKAVTFTALASSGEIFFRAIPQIKAMKTKVLKVASHGYAIDALAKGAADVAIVKDHVWEKHASEYPDIVMVGQDDGENPDNTLMISNKADMKVVLKVTDALLALKDDKSPEAKAVREQMSVMEFVRTTQKDFGHTMELLKRAGVDRSFEFAF